jgi:cell division protein ZapA
MSNLLAVNLLVGDRTYRIRLKAEDEEVVRKTAKKLNEQIAQFKSQYAGKDMQDYMAMVLLSYVTDTQSAAPALDDRELTLSLVRLESQLDRALEDTGSH